MNALNKIKKFIDDKRKEMVGNGNLSSPEVKLICEIDGFVNQVKEDKTNAEWVDPEVEMPTNEGIYLVLTDENSYGIAGYWEDEEGKTNFEVLFATAGKDPHINYWLKDNIYYLIASKKK